MSVAHTGNIAPVIGERSGGGMSGEVRGGEELVDEREERGVSGVSGVRILCINTIRDNIM